MNWIVGKRSNEISCIMLLPISFISASVVQWLSCSPPVRKIMGSNHGWINPKTDKFVFAASPLSTQHYEIMYICRLIILRISTLPLSMIFNCIWELFPWWGIVWIFFWFFSPWYKQITVEMTLNNICSFIYNIIIN